MTQKVTPFLMFDQQLEQALAFYTSTFPDSRVHRASRNGSDGPLIAADFEVGGQRVLAFNGGSYFRFSEAFSFFLDCADQAEVDHYWNALVAAGATPSQCGWITDPFGVSWQVVPRRFTEMLADPDPAKVKAVVAAMMPMQKLDLEVLEAAWRSA